jgi:hypothetical protein
MLRKETVPVAMHEFVYQEPEPTDGPSEEQRAKEDDSRRQWNAQAPPVPGSKCRSCKAPIMWLEHVVSRKKAPIDAEPVADGNILADPALGTYSVLTRDAVVPPGAARYTNHFQTCPDAKSFKRS